MVHQNVIKLVNIGLSKIIAEESSSQSTIPYIDPEKFNEQTTQYTLNEKSDVYSVGILLWEISSGKPPYYTQRQCDINLAAEILQGLREKIVPNTPKEYVKIYNGNKFIVLKL